MFKNLFKIKEKAAKKNICIGIIVLKKDGTEEKLTYDSKRTNEEAAKIVAKDIVRIFIQEGVGFYDKNDDIVGIPLHNIEKITARLENEVN